MAVTRSPGPQAHAGEGLAVAAGIDAETAHLAACEHRLRTHELADEAGVVVDQLAHALDHGLVGSGRACATGGGARAWRRRCDLGRNTDSRLRQRSMMARSAYTECSCAPPGTCWPTDDELGRLGAFANDGHAFLGVFRGEYAGQHQRHARRRGVGRVTRGLRRRVTEQMGVDQAADVQRRRRGLADGRRRRRLPVPARQADDNERQLRRDGQRQHERRQSAERAPTPRSASRSRRLRSDSRVLPSFP